MSDLGCRQFTARPQTNWNFKRIEMADNRVVVKINYDKDDKYRKALIDPKMVTVWHMPRIISALVVISLLAGLVYWTFGGKNAEPPKETGAEQAAQPAAELIRAQTELPAAAETVRPAKAEAKRADVAANRPPAIIYDKRVIRASVNTTPVNGEPGKPLGSPIVLVSGEGQDVYYFSQIKHTNYDVLFHRWFKNGQLNKTQKFRLKSNNEKLISSVKLAAGDVGEWRVVLISSQDQVLSEANFTVSN